MAEVREALPGRDKKRQPLGAEGAVCFGRAIFPPISAGFLFEGGPLFAGFRRTTFEGSPLFVGF